MSRPGQEVRRLAIHRTKIYNGGALLNYYNTPRASVSRDGRYVAFGSNFGVPEHPSVWVVDTGASHTTTTVSATVAQADTSAILNYVVPAGQTGSATIIVSASPSLTSPVVSATDGLTTEGRQYVATGLTANTQYHFRISTIAYSRTGSFRTLPALSGTGRLQLSKGGGGSIAYGATSSLGSTCTSPCDIAPSKGLLYTDSTGVARAVVVQ